MIRSGKNKISSLFCLQNMKRVTFYFIVAVIIMIQIYPIFWVV